MSARTTPTRSASRSTSRSTVSRHSSSPRRRPQPRRLSRLLAWLLSAVLGNAGLAYAQVPASTLPTGGRVVVGSAQVQQSPNLMLITQGTQRLGMDWQTFNIGSNAMVEFRQPGQDSIALNRVVGNSGSEIYGQLRANGQVFLVNPNGVLFAPGAKVDVGGLIASTLDITQSDFAAGRYHFNAVGNGGLVGGSVVNQGTLRADAGGYLALFGNRVDNRGEISVDAGAVVLASGRAATVSISGSGLISAVITPGAAGSVSNSGNILADGGVVRMSAASAEGIATSLVNNSGLVRANTIVERAGEIWITGDNVATSGQIVASAPNGGDGGRVMLVGDMQRGTAQVAGSIDASAASGRGGFVETSAATVNIADDARISTLAPGGTAGLWLIDPNNYTVAPSGGNITGATLSANLGLGNVAILTSQQGTAGGNGDIFVNDTVSWAGTRLTLTAERNIAINAPVTGTQVVGAGAASLALEYGQAAVAAGNTSSYTLSSSVSLPAGNNFLTKLGSNGATNTFTVVVDAAGLQGIDSLARTGNYALGANIDLSSIANFNPIADESAPSANATSSFSGRFEGLGHTVSALTINRTAGSVGLFASAFNADIRNLSLSAGSVVGTGFAGAVAGVAGGTTSLNAVRSTTPVSTSSTTQAVGGLIGQSGAGAVTGSSVGSVGNPVAISGGNYTGGLVGNAGTTTFTNSSAAVTLTGSAAYMGGLAGLAAGAVTGSSATGTAQTSGNAWLGGLIGNTSGTVSNSTADVDVTVTNAGSYVGGLLGASSASVSGSSAAGAVSGGVRTGGLVGSYASSGSINASSASGNVSSTVSSADVGGLVGNASGAGSVTASSATGSVTAGTNASSVGGLVGEFAMTAGIINSSAGAVAAGGNPASTVSGGVYVGGVVGYHNSATALTTDASNTISFRGSSVTGLTWAGGIVGYINSTASLNGLSAAANVTATGTGGGAGGLAGRSNGNVAGSSASGNVTGLGDVGGLIAFASGTGTLSNSSASGSVTNTSTTGGAAYAGGLVGRYALSGAITGAVTATGVVSGGSSAGGFVGYYNSAAAISGLTRGTASVTGRDYVGGVVGYSEAASISGSSSAANVTATSTAVGAAGGLAGRTTGSITNGTATGNVAGLYTVGGLIGLAEGTGTLTNGSATGNVTSSTAAAWIGGLVGQYALSGSMAGTISASGVVAGGSSAGGVVGYYNSTAPISGLTRGSASVSGQDWVGGLIGYSNAASITGSSSASNVTSTGPSYAAGGLAGRTSGSVSNSTATGNVTAAGDSGGLIGRAEGTGTLTDVSATGSVTSTGPSAAVGGLVGETNTVSITRGVARGAVTGRSDTGGLVGTFSATGSITDSQAYGNVLGGTTAGGLVGSGRGTYLNVRAEGSVTGTSSVGGLIGSLSSGGTVTNALAIGNVTSSGSYAGGLIGSWQYSGDIIDSRATGNVTSSYSSGYAGGLVGYAFGYSSTVAITNSSAAGNVSGGQYTGGLVGAAYDTQIARGTATGSVTTSNDSVVYAGGLVGYYLDYYYSGHQISNSSAIGNVSVDSSNARAGGLVGYFTGSSIIASTAGGNVAVKDSLNANNTSHQIGGLVGTFSGVSIADSAATGNVGNGYYAGGLVGNYSGSAPLSNSSATGNVSGTQYVGGLVGYTQSAGINNGFASGTVTGTLNGYTGGLVGYAYTYASGSISGINDSRATGNVSGGSYVGGLIGYVDDYNSSPGTTGGISNSRASGNVSGSVAAGGLLGYYNGPYNNVTGGISNSSASGAVEAGSQAGGLVGIFNSYSGVRDSFATGDVVGLHTTGAKSLGGLIGSYTNYNSTSGAGVLTRSYASGNVRLVANAVLGSSADVYAGGLVGSLNGTSTSALTLTDSYATGAVTLASTLGRLRAGGLVGLANGAISRAYATGAVSASGGNTRTVGGLVAQRNGSAPVTSSFWATDTSGQATSAGGTASTLALLRTDATFPADWDMATTGGTSQVWRIYDGQTTPLLRSFLTPLSVTLADVNKVYDGTSSLGSAAIVVNGTAVANPERILVAGVSSHVGSYGLTAANVYSVQNGYDLSVAGTANLIIAQRQLTLAGLAANKVYDATTAATVATNPQFGGLVAGENLTFQPGSGFALQFDSKTVGTGKTVNISGSYSLADGTNGLASDYLLPTATSTTANISLATLTAGSFSATNRAYDGTTTVAVSAAASALTGVLGGDSVSVDLSSVNSGTVANKNVGTAKAVVVAGVSLTGADAGNYTLAGLNALTVDVTPKTLTVNGINATDRQYDRSTSVALTTGAVSLSGLVTGDQVQARLTGLTGTMADKNVGTAKPVTIAGLGLRGVDAGNYSPLAGGVNVTISPRVVNLLLTTNGQTNRVYDGTTTASVLFYNDYYYSTNSIWGGDSVTIGTTSLGYNDKNVAYNTSGVPTAKPITASGISISGTDAANWAVQNTTTATQGTLTPKPLAVSGVTAANRVYDGTRDVSVTVSGATVDTTAVVGSDVVGVATPGTGTVTGQMVNKNVGNAKAVTVPGLALTGADAGNYSITSGTGGGVTVNITPKDVAVSYTASDKVYDSGVTVRTAATSTDFITGDVVSFISNDYVNLYYGYNPWASFTGTGARNVGTAKTVTLTYDQLTNTDSANYRLANTALTAGNATVTTTASITPKPVTLAFSSASRVYDGTTDATVTLNLSNSGVYSVDALSSTQTAAFTGTGAKNVGTSKPISVTGISLSGTGAGNYTVGNTTATTTGTVTAKPITVSGITATDRAYDGTTAVAVTAGTVTSAGFVAGDAVAITLPGGGLSTGTIANKNVGTNKPVTVTGLTLSGADALNYSIDATGSGITVNITQLALTPAYTGITRVYNGGVSASVTSSTGGIAAGDVVNFSQQAIFTGGNARDVGTAKPISISNIVISGAGAANYSLAGTTATASADITPKPVTAGYSGASRVYNGVLDVSAAVVGSSLQFVAGDSVGLTETARFTGDGSAGVNKPVSISGISLTGAQAANYSLVNNTATTTATISQRPLGVTGITATSRIYDGTTTVSVNVAGATVNTSSVIAGDVVSVTLPPSGISTGTLADRNVGNNKPVAITGLTIGGSSAANYSLIGATGLTANITPKGLTAVYGGVNRTYDGTADALVTATSGDILSIDALSVGFNAQGLFTAGKDVGTGKAVNVISAFLTGAARDNYALSNATGSTTADITPRQLTANYGGGNKVYDGSTSAVVTGTLANRIAGDNVVATETAVFTGTGARNVGNGKPISVSNIALAGSDAGNYTLFNTTDTTTGSISPKPITVSGLTNVAATDRIYDGTRVVAVTVPTGVTLVPNSSDIISGDVVTIDVPVSGVTTGSIVNKNVGNGKAVTVDGLTLTGADAGNYSIGGTAGISVNITPKSLTATYSGVNRVYDGTTAVSVTGASTDLISGDSLLIRGGGNFTGLLAKNVGTAKAISITSANLSGTDAGNYTLVNNTGSTTADVTQRSITPTYTGGSRVYDGSAAAPVSSNTANFVVGDSIALTQSASFTGSGARNAGTGKAIQVTGITLTGSDAVNYQLLTTNASTVGTITPKPISLTGLTGVTANDRVYDGTRSVSVTITSNGSIDVNAADIVAGDVVGVVPPTSGLTTGTMLNKNAGLNKALVVDGLALTGADAANYTVSATNGITVNVSPKSLVAVYTGVNRVYDGTSAATVVGTSADVVAGDSLSINGSGVFSAGKNAGTGKTITVTAGTLGSTDAGNYTLLNNTGSTSADITPRAATVSYQGGTRVYDGTTAAPVSGTLGGLISGDSVSFSQTAVFSGTGAKNVGSGKAVDVSGISLSGADAINYSLLNTSTSTTGTITPRPLGILGLTGVTAADRVYDGTRTVAVTVTTTGTVTLNPADLIAGDVVTITAPPTGQTTGTMADKNVGTAKAVAVAGLTLGGADAGNYSVASTSGVTVNITPKNLTAAYAGVNRVYDGTTAASATASSADIVAGDSVLISATGVFSGSGARNAGVGKTVDVQNGALSSTDAGNYSLVNSTGTATADITPRSVSASYAGGTRVYDGTTAAPVTRTASGFIAGDVVSVSETAIFSGTGAKNVGAGKAVLVSGILLSGSDAANYALTSTTTTTTGGITPRPLNVTGLSGITAVDRVYDGTVNVQVNVSGTLGTAGGDVIAGDNVTVNLPSAGLNSGTMLDKHVGQGKAVVLGGLSLSGADAGNYSLAGTAGLSVNITPKTLTASYTGANRVYDGTTAATITGSSADLVAGDAVTIAATGAFTGSGARNVGLAKPVTVQAATLSGADAGDYTLVVGNTSTTADITPRAVTATYAGGTRVYDSTTAAPVTRSLTGVIAGDSVSLGETAAFASKNVGNGLTISVSSINLGGTDAANYALAATSASTTGSITPRALNVSGLTGISAVDRAYDGSTGVQVNIVGNPGTATGNVLPGDVVQINVAGTGLGQGLMLDKHVGTNKPVSLSGLVLTGADAANYAIAGVAGVTVNITPLNVTAAGLAAISRAYDGTNVVGIDTSLGSLSGALAGDDVRLLTAGATATMADKNAGQGKAVNLAGLTMGGADARDYRVVSTGPGLTVNITPRALIAGLTTADKIYDGSTGAGSGLGATLFDDRIAGDALTLSATSIAFASKNVATGIAVTASGLTLSGADAVNYAFGSSTVTGTGTIRPAALTLTASSLSKVYGDAVTLGSTTQGLVTGETLGTLTLTSAGAAPTAAASSSPYVITAAIGSGGTWDPNNYNVMLLNGSLTVTARPLTIAGSNTLRYENDLNRLAGLGFSSSVGGLANGDSVDTVTLSVPSAAATAPGGSRPFTLGVSNAHFASGSASNYSITYVPGSLAILPVSKSGTSFAIELDPLEVANASTELQRASRIASASGDERPAVPATTISTLDAAVADIAAMLSGDGRRINLPALQRMPLISLDPQLRRILSNTDTAVAP